MNDDTLWNLGDVNCQLAVGGGKDREEMSRLIDADLLKQNCKCTGGFNDNFVGVDLITLAQVIDNQPTAFDTEKVVEQLEKKQYAYIHDNGYYEEGKYYVFEESIDIVKKGGVE